MKLSERYEKLEPRERRLLGGLVVAFALLLVVFLPAYLYQSVSSKRDENQEIIDYIDKVRSTRAKIEKDKAQRDQQEARYAKSMPPIAAFIESAAKANGVEIDESGPKPDVPHGKKYVEKVQSMRLRKVGLLGLVRTFERIEKSGYPVAITRLNLKPRSDGPDSYDVEANVSVFEQKGVQKKAAAAEADTADDDDEETP